MNLALVIGTCTATVRHPSLKGWRLLVVQPQMVDGGDDGEPLLVIDNLGAPVGAEVVITSDGKAISEALQDKRTPVRWMVLAQPDPHAGTR